MSTDKDYISINKELWNAKTPHHLKSGFYDVKGFMQGASSLKPVELGLLGDVKGKSLLHLQCHFGQDTLSLARMGARVTGMDISDESIKQANLIAGQLGLEAEFICCDIYDLPQYSDKEFDIVFTSYGVLGWLPDLDAWAGIVSRFLKQGGVFVMVEFHPVVWMFDDEFKEVAFSYFNREPIIETLEGTYANRDAPIALKEVGWNHGLGEVLGSLLKHGLEIREFEEYDHSPYDCFKNTEKTPEGNYRIKRMGDRIPLMYSVKAVKN
jgi:ubiquinone/menaquinone biosynthesis C-methylase UbiE